MDANEEVQVSKKRPLDETDTNDVEMSEAKKPKLDTPNDSQQREDSSSPLTDTKSDATTTTGEADAQPKKRKYPKRKFALLMAYNGENYNGSQRNPGVVTIESVMEDALCKIGAISEQNAHSFSKTCSRTDKGVSALGNITSVKLLTIPDLLQKFNEALPPEIRCLGMKRVTGAFNPRLKVDGRWYDYALPTYCFRPNPKLFPDEAKDWKFTNETREQINAILKGFCGSHNFHNFTKQVAYEEAQAVRYIKSYTCSEPYVIEGMEFVTLSVIGQSFMLHQIRKMTSVAVQLVRDKQSVNVIYSMYGPARVSHIFKAPGEGLLLRQCIFDSYNKTVSDPNPPLTWDEALEAQVEFARKMIIPRLAAMEREHGIYEKWLAKFEETPLNYEEILSRLHESASYRKLKQAEARAAGNSSEAVKSVQTQNAQTSSSDFTKTDDKVKSGP